LTIRQLDAFEDNIELAVSPLIVRSGALPLQATIKRVVNIPSINSLTVRLTEKGRRQTADARREEFLPRCLFASWQPQGSKGLKPPLNPRFDGFRLGWVGFPFQSSTFCPSGALPCREPASRHQHPLPPALCLPFNEDDAKMRRFSLGILSIIHVENVLEIERSFLVIFWLINSSISV
jgi:hypothetical protein